MTENERIAKLEAKEIELDRRINAHCPIGKW